MIKKILRLFVLSVIILSMVACGDKQTQTKLFNNLFLLYATPKEIGLLPLKIFSENDSLFVQYIKNGKPLGKIWLVFNHSEKKINDVFDLYYFDEVVDEKNTGGTYVIPDFLFDAIDYLGEGVDGIIYYQTKTKFVEYYVDWSLSKDRNNTHTMDDVWREKNVLDFLYSVYSNPIGIEEKSLFDDMGEIWTSEDGNLSIYNHVFDLGGNGWGSGYPLEIVQFRNGNNVSAFCEIDWGYENLHLQNFIYTENIKIHTIYLNQKIYYLIDRAIYDGMPMPYLKENEMSKNAEIEDGQYSNGNVLQIYAIEDGELVKKKLFNTTKKIIDNIAIEYDESSDMNRAYSNLFKYDETEKIIYVPLVDGVKLTNKYLLYQWDGSYFTYKGINDAP